MYYTIYETTNKINGNRYIGKHQTEDLNDNYLGSGIRLKHAIQKYGIENFSKEILHVFETEDEMNDKEKELITLDIIKDECYYNISLGGYGGNIVLFPDHPLYDQTRKRISESAISRGESISRSAKENHRLKKIGMYGRKQSDKQKEIVSKIHKGKIVSQETKDKQKISLMKTFSDPSYVHPNKGKSPHNKGKPNPAKMKNCIYCNRNIDARNYGRYHGEKCKSNEI